MIPNLLQRRGLRQFVKFCIVGASSTLINLSIYLYLIEGLDLARMTGSLLVARPLAQVLAFVCAVTNGFYWNNRWTFRSGDRVGKGSRYAKFVVTNLIGLCLNLIVLTAVAHLVPPALARLLSPPFRDPQGFIGILAATLVVVFWNFSASKYWTFRE